MILWELVEGFFKVGCFAFGGAYAAIPLIRDVVLQYGWLREDVLTNMIAISESTPGPIMVNLATYVGSSQAGFTGAVLATLAVVLPSFVVILAITAALRNLLKSPYVRALLQGMKPAILGIILATGCFLLLQQTLLLPQVAALRIRHCLIAGILLGMTFANKYVRHKKLSPILLLTAAAILGVLVF